MASCCDRVPGRTVCAIRWLALPRPRMRPGRRWIGGTAIRMSFVFLRTVFLFLLPSATEPRLPHPTPMRLSTSERVARYSHPAFHQYPRAAAHDGFFYAPFAIDLHCLRADTQRARRMAET